MRARRLVHIFGAMAILAGGLATGPLALMPGTASAAGCGGAAAAGSDCTLTGTADLTGGALNLTSPSSYPGPSRRPRAHPAAVTIYDAAASSGTAQVIIGGSTEPDRAGWRVNVPASASAGSCTPDDRDAGHLRALSPDAAAPGAGRPCSVNLTGARGREVRAGHA